MKVRVLHISDSFAYPSLGKDVEEEILNLSSPEDILEQVDIRLSPEDIVEKIYEERKDLATNLFLINLNYKTKGVERSQNKGIMLLKLLRLRGCLKHCVLYSFLPREYYIEKDPTALILYSPGVTFVQLPADLSSLSYVDLSKKEAPRDLKAYFKAESILPDNRHFFANWWGILKLWEVQEVVENPEGKQSGETAGKKLELPESLRKEKNSYHGLLARYVHDMPEDDIKRALRHYESEVRKSQGQVELNQKLLTEFAGLKQQETGSEGGLWKRVKNRLISLFQKEVMAGFEQKIQSNIESHAQREKEDQEQLSILQKAPNREEDLKRRIGEVLPSDDNSSSKSTQDLRKSLREKAPRILYVDDQANDGWAEVIQRMVYGEINKDLFEVIVPEKEKEFNLEALVNSIIEKTQGGIDLLILDLRLQGEADKNLALSEVSGMKVLSILRECDLPCPILITTASNKVWTYKETLAQGAMAYWIKQGLDADNSVEATVENYQSLLRTIYWLCNHRDLQSLFSLPKAILELDHKKESFWWLQLDPAKSKEDLLSKVIGRLWDTFEIYRSFVNATLDSASFNRTLTELQYATIVSSMHLIFEDLFPKGEFDERLLAQRMVDNGCEHLRFFSTIRNTAVHTGVCGYCVAHDYIIHLIELLKSESVRRIGRVESVEYNKRYQSWTLELTQQSGCEEPVWLYSRKNGNDRIHESIEEKLPAGMISEVLIAEEFVGKNVEYTLTIDPKGTHYANKARLVDDDTIERCNESNEEENTGMLE